MSRLQELIERYCPDGVEYKRIGDVFTRIKGTPITAATMKKIACENGEIRIYAGGRNIIQAREEDIPKANITRVPAVLVQSRGVIGFVYVDVPFTFKNEMWAYTHPDRIALQFLAYCLMNNVDDFRRQASGMGSLPQISIGVTDNYRIPVPPIEVQCEVVRILDEYTVAHDELVRQLEEEITARELEYETIIREEFSNRFGDPCTKDDAFDKLGNHCRVITGNTPSRSHAEYFGPGIDWIKSDNIHADARSLDAAKEQLTEDGARAARIAEPGWLLMICIAGSPNTIGNTSMVDRRVAYNQQINGIDPLGVNARFLQCALTLAKQKIERTLKPAVTCILNKRELESLLLPFPPREEQDEFAAMLERLDSAGFNDYRDTLREELVLRERQLALMRNQLLSFPEKVA